MVYTPVIKLGNGNPIYKLAFRWENHQMWGFSIAMFDYQRLTNQSGDLMPNPLGLSLRTSDK